MQAAQVDKLTGQLTQIVLSRLQEGRLVLTSPPTVVAKCLQMLKSPDFQAKKLIAQVEVDPVLAAIILREASAASHGNAVKANMAIQTINPSKASMYKTGALGKNGPVIANSTAPTP